MGDTWAFGPAPKQRKHRSKILGAVVGFVAAASLVAVAMWLVNGPGQGTGKIGKLVAPTVEGIPFTEVPATIFPGATGDFMVRAFNPNAGPLFLSGYEGAILQNDLGGLCVAHLSAPDVPPGTLHIGPFPPGVSTTVTVPNSILADAGLPTECQDQIVIVNLSTPTSGGKMFWST